MQECNSRKPLLRTVAPIIIVLLILPLGLCLGTLAGLLSDFGCTHRVQNIKLNPEMFAKQYGPCIVFNGWAAAAVLVASAAVVGAAWIRRRGGRDGPVDSKEQ